MIRFRQTPAFFSYTRFSSAAAFKHIVDALIRITTPSPTAGGTRSTPWLPDACPQGRIESSTLALTRRGARICDLLLSSRTHCSTGSSSDSLSGQPAHCGPQRELRKLDFHCLLPACELRGQRFERGGLLRRVGFAQPPKRFASTASGATSSKSCAGAPPVAAKKPAMRARISLRRVPTPLRGSLIGAGPTRFVFINRQCARTFCSVSSSPHRFLDQTEQEERRTPNVTLRRLTCVMHSNHTGGGACGLFGPSRSRRHAGGDARARLPGDRASARRKSTRLTASTTRR